MNRIPVPLGGRSYDITIENRLLESVGSRLRTLLPQAQRLALVTDENVYPLYGESVAEGLRAAGFAVAVTVLPAGESSKTLRTLGQLYAAFAAHGLTRTDAVAALGGGVVGDVAGFAAATMLRGIDYVQIPTTLLAQVDSSVGGKTAIDLPAGKNLVGAFWQPRAVYIDPMCLKTLPDDVFAEGMAEVIKYGCIGDEGFFALLERCAGRDGIMQNIEQVIATCCRCKAVLVAADETDTGARMLLNYGHTFGHAYEQAVGYEGCTHGQAVAAGMCTAARLGERMGVTRPGTAARLKALLRQYGLPTEPMGEPAAWASAIAVDKKNTGALLRPVLLERIGAAKTVAMERDALMALLGDITE